MEKELVKIEIYWKRFLKKHDTFDFEKNAENLLAQIGADKKLSGKKYFDKSKVDKIKKVYERTILFMPLLINEETGGVSASLEIDEQRDKCGKYAYCWIRDAVLMYCSLQYLNFGDNIERFYDYFLKVTQSSNGMWFIQMENWLLAGDIKLMKLQFLYLEFIHIINIKKRKKERKIQLF